MQPRALVMIAAIVLTLAAPAVLSLKFSGQPVIRRRLLALAMGLLMQIVGEVVLLYAGARSWLPFFETPLVAIRLYQLFLLLRMTGLVGGVDRVIFSATIWMNLGLWIFVGVRLVQQISLALSI